MVVQAETIHHLNFCSECGPDAKHLPPAECLPIKRAHPVRHRHMDSFPPATFPVVFHVQKGRTDRSWNAFVHSTNI